MIRAKTPKKINWEVVAREVIRIDGKRCVNLRCKATGPFKTALSPHHIIYRSDGGPDEMWNLMTLCADCHRLAQEGDKSAPARKHVLRMLEELKEYYATTKRVFRWQKALDDLRRKIG